MLLAIVSQSSIARPLIYRRIRKIPQYCYINEKREEEQELWTIIRLTTRESPGSSNNRPNGKRHNRNSGSQNGKPSHIPGHHNILHIKDRYR